MVLQQKPSSPIGIWMWYSFVASLATSVNIPIQETNTFHHGSTLICRAGMCTKHSEIRMCCCKLGELKKDLWRIQPIRLSLMLGSASKRIQKGPKPPQFFPQRWTIWGATKHHLIARPHFVGSTKKTQRPHPSDFLPDHSVNALGGWFDLPLDVIRCHWHVCTNLEKTATKSSLGEGVEILVRNIHFVCIYIYDYICIYCICVLYMYIYIYSTVYNSRSIRTI